MRRTDREITDLAGIKKIIDKCAVMRVGFADGDTPYIVPLNFACEEKDGRLTFIFHCAAEGRKIDMIQKNPRVCIELDCLLNIVSSEQPQEWTTEYESVIAYGDALLLSDIGEKKAAMDALMRKYGFAGTPEYPEAMLARVAVGIITVSEITGKRNKR